MSLRHEADIAAICGRAGATCRHGETREAGGLPVQPELAVIAPALNERGNVGPLYEALDRALAEVAWELVIVDDDSHDGTGEAATALARRDPRVRVLKRIGRRGLASACIEGVLATTAPYFAVIDADLQHDERLLPEMLKRLKSDGLDLVVGSRVLPGGSDAGLEGRRKGVSALGRSLAHSVMKLDLTDPMSGYFMMRRDSFDRLVRRLSGIGYKILVDIMASAEQPLKVVELPYTFRKRVAGDSKFDGTIAAEFLLLLFDKHFGAIVPPRFVMFSLVGGIGVLVHMAALYVAFALDGLRFDYSQGIATVIAMTSNFFLNNFLTYRDRRLRGVQILRGLVSFYAVCSFGAIANVAVAALIYEKIELWYIAGFIGTLISAIWNYSLSAFATWRR